MRTFALILDYLRLSPYKPTRLITGVSTSTIMNLPERLVGEIIGGRLYRQPHSAGPHAVALSTLVMDIVAPFIEDAAVAVDGES